jgi:hypothetical protein
MEEDASLILSKDRIDPLSKDLKYFSSDVSIFNRKIKITKVCSVCFIKL